MLARIATFDFGTAERGERVLATVRAAARPEVEGIPGWRGVVQLLDPTEGRATVVHFLDDELSLAAAEATFRDLRRRFTGGSAEALRELDRARRSVTVTRVVTHELERLVGPPAAPAR